VEFGGAKEATMALKRLSGATMLLTADKTRIPFRLNLASFAVGAAAHTTSSVHVSKLPEEYTDYLLEQKFRELCGSSGTSHVLIEGGARGQSVSRGGDGR
jgi:hypothetical protein